MNRFSGIAIFSSGYTVCITAVICLLQIKYDARELQQDQLISPEIKFLDSEAPAPIQYVLMNPIKENYPVQLDRPMREANFLVAILPSGDSLAKSHSAASLRTPHFANREIPLMNPWNWFRSRPQPTPQPFALTSSTKPVPAEPVAVASRKEPMVLPIINALPAPEPHVLVANDHEGIQAIRQSLNFLSQIDWDPEFIELMNDRLDALAENGSMDASICESTIYQILNEVEKLNGQLDPAHPEDRRLIDSATEQINQTLNAWIDLLNGIQLVPHNTSAPELF